MAGTFAGSRFLLHSKGLLTINCQMLSIQKCSLVSYTKFRLHSVDGGKTACLFYRFNIRNQLRQQLALRLESSGPKSSSASGSRKKERPLPVTWKSVGIAGGIGMAFLVWMLYLKQKKDRATYVNRQREIGKAKIGGDWELTDMNGKLRVSQEFHGSWILIYFGFTHCPDICPDEIEKMMKTRELLEKRLPKEKFETLFITVDPARDTVEAVKRYCKEFSPKLLGLTGTQEQIKKAAKSYRVYYSAAEPDPDNDYIVDHTIIIYFINKDGKFVDYYGQNKTPEQMADHIESHINRHDYLNL